MYRYFTDTEITCVASPTKRNLKSRFSGQSHDWKHLYLRFFYTTFRNSAITPASPLIENSTLRSSLWCSHCSVKATAVFVSSRDRDFATIVGKCGSRLLDLCFLVLWPSVFFTAPSMSSTRTYGYFAKISYIRCNVFF